MCSINGFNFQDEDLILKMNQITKHRGPDGTRVFLGDGVSLGHNRLSIIDLSNIAAQPMKSNRGDLAIVFNGEIYNFKALKEELSPTYQFKTTSDTEVILAAYEKWGKECVKRLSGMFAFAIWDSSNKELFLARDHIGIKPLYYFWDGKKFIFSSEIKAILEHDIPRKLHREAFNHYFRVLYVPEPLTMFQGIYKVPPATSLVLKDGTLQAQTFWQTPSGAYFHGSRDELERTLRQKILSSVESQLVSDRPLGVYLSGGIDSSIVLSALSGKRKNIDTFSVGFELREKEQQEKFNADFYLARRTAKHFGTNHHEVLLGVADVLRALERAVWHMDEPISNPTALAMMVLADFAKQKADVVLGGDGGDELFGGYERYRLSLAARYWQVAPSWFREPLERVSGSIKKLNTPAGIDRFSLFMFQKEALLGAVIQKPFLSHGATEHFFNEKYFKGNENKIFEEIFMDTDRKSWLVDFSLMLSDKMSMSAGLEARVPLLDKDVVEFAATIPLKEKISLFDTKIILKKAFKNDIPDFLFKEPKRGWFSPAAKWLRHPDVYRMAEEILSGGYYPPTALLFLFDEIKKILEEHRDSKTYNLNILWAIMTFQIWARAYKIEI